MNITKKESVVGFENDGGNRVVDFPEASALSDFGIRRFSAECLQKLAEIKDRIASELANQFNTLSAQRIRQMVNEADSLAATTPFPALLLPVLAEEKVRSASAWA